MSKDKAALLEHVWASDKVLGRSGPVLRAVIDAADSGRFTTDAKHPTRDHFGHLLPFKRHEKKSTPTKKQNAGSGDNTTKES